MNLPKAGVYAVRSGKPLAKSIRNYITNKPKYLFNHKNNYLALIGLSNGNAIATKYGFSNLSKFNFIIKKIIDKNFVRKFNQYERIPLALKLKICGTPNDLISTLSDSVTPSGTSLAKTLGSLLRNELSWEF